MSDAEAVQRALERMRSSAVKAVADAQGYTGPLKVQAQHRAELFAQTAADLAGTTVAAELERAHGVPPEPAWSLS